MLKADDSAIISSRSAAGGSEQPPQSSSCRREETALIPSKGGDAAAAAADETCHRHTRSCSADTVGTSSISPPAQPRQPRRTSESEEVGSSESSAEAMIAPPPAPAPEALRNTASASAGVIAPAPAAATAAAGSNGNDPLDKVVAATDATTSRSPACQNYSVPMHKQAPSAPRSGPTAGAVTIARPAIAMMVRTNQKLATSPAAATSIERKTSSGRWSQEEHDQFLEGLKVYGREWKKVAQRIPTRTSAQIRSHAQKYFAKLAKEEEARLATVSAIAREHQGGSGNGFEMGIGMAGENGDGEGDGAGRGRGSGTALLLPPEQRSLLLSEAAISPVQLTSSAMNRVGRILSDPEAVQVEVEDALVALRRRYQELQRRLYGNTASDEGDGDGRGGIGGPAILPPPPTALFKEDTTSSCNGTASTTGKKRKIGEAMPSSSIATTPTAQKPQTTKILENRELWTEELIALSVLGGSLQQGDSPKREEPAAQPIFEEGNHSTHTCAHRNDAEATAESAGLTIKKKAKKDVGDGSDAKEG